MNTETIAALVRSHKRVMRCEQHLAEIHGRLQATSLALAQSLQLVQAHGGEAMPAWQGTQASDQDFSLKSDKVRLDGQPSGRILGS